MPDDDFARYMSESFPDVVLRRSAERKADPLPFALDALEDLFGHEDDKEQGFRRFRQKLEQFVPWADDAVQCLELVLADPPEDLGRRVREAAGVVVWVQVPGGERPGDDAANVEWLQSTVGRLRAMLDSYVAERLGRTPPS
jgi:hypothetical protein